LYKITNCKARSFVYCIGRKICKCVYKKLKYLIFCFRNSTTFKEMSLRNVTQNNWAWSLRLRGCCNLRGTTVIGKMMFRLESESEDRKFLIITFNFLMWAMQLGSPSFCYLKNNYNTNYCDAYESIIRTLFMHVFVNLNGWGVIFCCDQQPYCYHFVEDWK
jgi:hypothetical protein